MRRYSTAELARLLELPVSRIHAATRAGVLEPVKAGRAWRFGFSDALLLKTARELSTAGTPWREVLRAMQHVKNELSEDGRLTAVRLLSAGRHVAVRDSSGLFDPLSGQTLLDFSQASLAPQSVASIRQPRKTGAELLFAEAVMMEEQDPQTALDMYTRLTMAGADPDAHVNRGRLLQEQGKLADARADYEHALGINADHAIAAFNLGTVLEDLGELDAAVKAYERAAERELGDAHFNLARLFHRAGDERRALRHLMAIRKARRH